MNAPIDPSQLLEKAPVLFGQVPLMERARFAELVGVSEFVVQGWIVRGYLPVFSIGKYNLINLVALNQQLLLSSLHHLNAELAG